MKYSTLLFFGICAVMLFTAPLAYAEDAVAPSDPSSVRSELPPSPAREEILRLLRPEEWFQTLQQYIKAPLPGTGVEDIEVDEEKVSELNLQISRETGVDIVKFFQFVGKVFVILLEGTARIIRGFLPGG